MKKMLAIALLVSSAAAFADERTPWKEPEVGPLSSTGTTLDVENYHCIVKNPRSINCLNVGRVCIEQRARDEARSARRFGCAIEKSKNYPCPVEDQAELDKERKAIGSCWPMMIGGF